MNKPEPQRVEEIEYIIYPGFVTSKRDGDLHYISAQKLMTLYGVEPKKCRVAVEQEDIERIRRKSPEALLLTPLAEGNYSL